MKYDTFFLITMKEVQKIWTKLRRPESSDLPFTIEVHEKLYFEAYINNQNIYAKIIVHFILKRSKWCLNFPVYRGMARRFTALNCTYGYKVHYFLQKLWISEPSLSTLGKFKHHLDLLAIKFIHPVLFFEINILGIYEYFKI